MASFCPVDGSVVAGAAGTCVCSVGQYPVNGTCRGYPGVSTNFPENTTSEFVPPLPTAASWTNNNAQLISFEITCTLVGVWCLFCLGLRFAPLERNWFRIRHNISRCDVIFSKHHWFDEQKTQVKRRTEMGGALSLGSLLFFVGLTAGLIWDLETQKQYTVESVVVASNRQVQQFDNDLDFIITGFGSLRCAMLGQSATVTTGMIAEEVRTVPPLAPGNALPCNDTVDGVVLRVRCPNCTAARENYVINAEFTDRNGTQAYAVGWNYSACAVHKSQHYRSCVSGTLAGGSNGAYAPAATLRGPLASVLAFRFFPRIFRQFDPELLLLEAQFRQYTAGSYAADDAALRPLLAAPAGVRLALSLEIASSFIVITKSQSTNGVLTFLAKAGGLYALSYWLFYLVLMQFEKRIKRLRYDDKILNTRKRQHIAQLRWDKVRLFVKYSRFGSRKPRAEPGQVILDVRDDVEAPRGDLPGGASREAHFADKLKQTLSKLTDLRSDEEMIKDFAQQRDSLFEGGSRNPAPHPPAPNFSAARNVQFQRSLIPLPTETRTAGRLQRTASLPGGSERQQRNPAPLPDFCLAQHIPRTEGNADSAPGRAPRSHDYLLESQPSLREEPGEITGQPSRLRGGAPSPPNSPPAENEAEDVSEISRFRGVSEPRHVDPSNAERSFASSPGVSPRGDLAPLFRNDRRPKPDIQDGLLPNERGRDLGSPVGDFPRERRIHVSPPPSRRIHVSLPPRTLTPPLPTTPSASRQPQSPTKLFADVAIGRRSRKRPKPITVQRNESEVSLAASEPGSSTITPNSERGHHRRTASGSGVALLANIQRGLSRVIPGNLPHLHIPGLRSGDGPRPSDEEVHARLMQKTRKKLGYRRPAQHTGLVVRRLKRPSWLGHNCSLPAVPDAPLENSDDATGTDDGAPDVFAMYNHLQDLYDYNVRLREDFLLAQSMLENVVQRFRPHSDL